MPKSFHFLEILQAIIAKCVLTINKWAELAIVAGIYIMRKTLESIFR